MAWFVAGFVALRVLGIAFLVLLVTRIMAGARSRNNEAREIASRRFASGEITEEQLRRMQEVLDTERS
jgi:uncharacterized membrane protein